MQRIFLLTLTMASAAAAVAETGGLEKSATTAIDFNRDVRPILSDNCYKCHGFDEGSRAADLRLDQRQPAIDYGAIVPGDVENSEIIRRILSDDPDEVMPPPSSNKSLSDDDIATLKHWVAGGAVYEPHWSFTRIERPEVPHGNADRSPIDSFVRAKLNEVGLQPSPAADRYTLIRRVTQDLTGLLPTPEEADAFVADTSPDAYESLVDRLLASPHYGERWGRHWLDQARYADSNGYTVDGPRTMWPYRDWVLVAVNEDMPFDQFTIEQLAGDLLPNATRSQRVATAFHRNTMINQEGGVKPDQFRNEALIDRVNTTTAVWLGLTAACAQCHTHKYDPLSHTEYYQFYAFFNAAADANNVGPKVDVFEGELTGQWTAEQIEGLHKSYQLRVAKRPYLKKQKKKKDGTKPEPLTAEEEAKLAELNQQLAALKKQGVPELRPGEQMVLADVKKPKSTYRLDRGDFLSPDEEQGALQPGVPAVLQTDPASLKNRLDLARWLVSRDNPLTARVTVNRIWMRYFGIGLVPTENDFGLQGTSPSHPKLLDWLAVEFMEPSDPEARPWSMKHLHKTIVLSDTYRQSSAVSTAALERDAANKYLSHQSRFRVEAEIVRDQALVASELFTPTLGGPPVHPPQPDGIYSFTQTKKKWPTETGPNRYRRTMYTMFYRSAPHPLLTTFDAPDFSVACTRRVRSNTPLQALAIANDPMFLELAEGIGTAAAKFSDDVDEQIARMIRLTLTRPAADDERQLLRDYYNNVAADTDAQQARAAVARVLLNTDEFVTRN